MSRYCVASHLPGWALQQPFAGYSQPPTLALAVAFIGGLSRSGFTSVTSHSLSRSHQATVLARVSPLGFLALEAGFSYLQWLSTISNSYSDPIYYNATDNDTLHYFPTYTMTLKDSILVYSKDLITPPSKNLATLSQVSKDLIFVDWSPVCNWEYGTQPLDSGEEPPPPRRSERIAALSARGAASRTTSAPNTDHSRGRGLRGTNGRRRIGPPNPAGGGSKIGSSSGRRGRKRAGGAAPPPPGPPSPPSTHSQEDDPEDDPDGDDVGWMYFFFSCIVFLVSVIGSAVKYQISPAYHIKDDTDLIVVKPPLEGYPFIKTSRLDMHAFILFFFLCLPGAARRRSNIGITLKTEAIPASAQIEDKSTASAYTDDVAEEFATATEDQDETDSLVSELAFFTNAELSFSTEDRGKTPHNFSLSTIYGPPVEVDFQEAPVGAADVSVTVITQDNSVAGVGSKDSDPLSASSSLIKRRPAKYENAIASSSKVTPVVSRLFVPVYKHYRSHPRTLTVFVQANAPRERGFIHFDLPNYGLPNNRFQLVDFSRRETPFFLREKTSSVGGVRHGGEGDV
ncbi:hypothetical protein CVT25_014565 [Psilocybe cyanescens]|uniref:Uncharacterized protein n=1 Tax=Psilocybe cyanescens TaxID=93625 RepID=A0A409WRH7_PSICY|nr:hypothetical protein CVT25_014565 [Psilocybe cyanescens]